MEHWGLIKRFRCFRTDWLHVADEGVTPDFIAQMLWKLLPKLDHHPPHRIRVARVAARDRGDVSGEVCAPPQ